jgi:hypothetical protein
MQKKAQKIIEIIQNHEIQIIDFLIFNEKSLLNHNQEEFQRISLNSKFVDENLLINGFENEEFQKVLPNLNFYFFNLFSSKISLQIICRDQNKDFSQKNTNLYITQNPIINFYIKNNNSPSSSFNLIYDLCAEVFEYFERIENNSLQKYSLKSFFIENEQNIKFEINYIENLACKENLVEFFYKSLILKNIIRNAARNFNFETEFKNSFCKFQINSKEDSIKIPYPFSLYDLEKSINF